MHENDKDEKFYTLPLSYIMDQLQLADDQMIGSQSLLAHFFESNEEKHRLLIPVVVNILWSNFAVIDILKPYIEDPVFVDNPETGEQEYMIIESALLNLQAMLLSRYYANKELSRFPYSIGLH